jgi:hypothetical protein
MMVLLLAGFAHAKDCTTGKPCGDACIAKEETCHKATSPAPSAPSPATSTGSIAALDALYGFYGIEWGAAPPQGASCEVWEKTDLLCRLDVDKNAMFQYGDGRFIGISMCFGDADSTFRQFYTEAVKLYGGPTRFISRDKLEWLGKKNRLTIFRGNGSACMTVVNLFEGHYHWISEPIPHGG